MVKKIFCQNSLIRSSTVALMTALSNDSDTSRMPRIAHSASAVQPPYRNATTSETSVTTIEIPNTRMTTRTPSFVTYEQRYRGPAGVPR